MVLFEVRDVQFKEIITYPNMSIFEGDVTFIGGDSGTGKSTLLKLLNNTLSTDMGQILYKGELLTEIHPIELRKKVLLSGQNVYLFDGTIRDNFLKYYSYRSLSAPDDEMIREYLELCCADFDLNALCQNLSGGERQRVYLALFISFMPEVLMLDEPSSALDRDTADTMIKNISHFCKERLISLIIVSHDPILKEKYADRSIYLERKRQNNE